ncbi:hypothetical protein N7478_008945 [Penicillium angulare]|uniref:uncharacterized protein n=1 Tax=Penicillium angulare TaxID=116970 RepID=UPI00253FF63C|nr:uncharacterized protein N7478_008945 [Penicillium angulare]KAJ5273820.1 hypothetical protein N7478_008945 [Penicillium angulare]
MKLSIAAQCLSFGALILPLVTASPRPTLDEVTEKLAIGNYTGQGLQKIADFLNTLDHYERPQLGLPVSCTLESFHLAQNCHELR